MKGFIEVTTGGGKRLLNLAEIAWIQPGDKGTFIRCRDLECCIEKGMTGGFTVMESYAEVKGKISVASV